MIASWILVIAIITYSDNSVWKPVWQPIAVFPTQRECFAALEREQLAHDHLPHKTGVLYFYRCDAPSRP
jgi:hypothetical protein